MAKLTLTDLTSGFGSITTMNANHDLIEAALENTLSRDGTSPNSMSADFDLNSNDILNGGTLNAADIVVAGTSLITQVNAAAASAAAASTSETNAAASETLASQWASLTGALVAATDYSAKEYAIGTTVAAGSAKDWAIEAEDTVVDGGSGYSAYHWAQKALGAAGNLELYGGTVSGTDTYTFTSGASLSVYTTGMLINGLVTNANTGAATLNVDTLGAKTITDIDGNAVVAGEIAAGSVHLFRYDGTNFQLINPNITETNQTIAGDWTLSGTTVISGLSTTAFTGTPTVSGNATLSGNLTLSGTNTHSGALSVTGNFDSKDIIDDGTGVEVGTATGQGAGTLNVQNGVYVGGSELYLPTDVAGYYEAQNTTIHDDASNSTGAFNVDFNIGAAWESVGPTGSSATNIWTAMNDLPSTAKGLIYRYYVDMSGTSTTTDYRLRTYARRTGSTFGTNSFTTISDVRFYNATGATYRTADVASGIIPLDGNLRFDLYVTKTGSPSLTTDLVIVGWIE